MNIFSPRENTHEELAMALAMAYAPKATKRHSEPNTAPTSDACNSTAVKR
jgi:hypothetical protein